MWVFEEAGTTVMIQLDVLFRLPFDLCMEHALEVAEQYFNPTGCVACVTACIAHIHTICASIAFSRPEYGRI